MDYCVFDKMLDAVLVVDRSKSIVYCNEAFASMIGVSLKRLRPGKKGYDFIQFEQSDVFMMPEGTWGMDGPTLYKEFHFTTSKGNSGEASVCIRPLESANETHYVHFMRDMTLEIQLQKKYRAELEQKEDVIVDLKKAQKELQKYSKNLEDMVDQRTAELKKSNQFIKTMVDSMGQGLLVFNRQNKCMPIYTKACEEIFGMNPSGRDIWRVLSLGPQKAHSFAKWSDSLFSQILPFEDLKDLGPKDLANDKGQYIALEYFPFNDDDGSLQGVVMVATDKTKEQKAKQEAQRNQEYVTMIIKLVKNKNQFLSFVKDSRKMVTRLVEMTAPEREKAPDFSELGLLMHSIKGGAGVYSILPIFELAHDYESDIEVLKEKGQKAMTNALPDIHTKMVDLKDKLEKHFVEYKSFLGDAVVDGLSRVEIETYRLEDFSQKLTGDRQMHKMQREFIQSFIKRPAFHQLLNYSDMVVELAQNTNKKMNPILFNGKKVKVNPEYYSELFTTMVHAFTNVVAHGLEAPSERKKKGRPSFGSVEVSFFPYREKGQRRMQIIIEDDGRGIAPDSIRDKLKENGMNEQDLQKLSDHEVIQYIFEDSFSTAESVSKIAGRGVGMSAIKDAVEKMNGSVVMESLVGHGSKLIIDVVDH